MKKIMMAFFAAACLLGSCSEEKTGDQTATQDSIDISSKTIEAGPKGHTAEIKVTSSDNWRLSGVCDWAHPSAVEGRNGETVTFTIDPNTTDKPREATFKFFTGSAVVALNLSSELGHLLELLSEPALAAPTDGMTFMVKVKTNITELDTAFSGDGADWIHLVNKSAAFGIALFEFRMDKHLDYSDRSTTLTISGEKIPAQVAITQSKAIQLLVDETKREYDTAAREIEVEVQSNVVVTVGVESQGGWITRLDDLSGIINGTLRFALTEATETRGGKITISGGGVTRIIPINQMSAGATSVSIPDEEFRNRLIDAGWMTSLGGNQCEVTAAGLAATVLNYPSIGNDPIISLEGIEALVNLERIVMHEQGFDTFDISALKNVTSVDIDRTGPIEIILGDNPVERLSFTMLCGYDMSWAEVYPKSLVVSGTRLKSLLLPAEDLFGTGRGDKLETIDVSGCPALETLNCKRFDGLLTTVYLKTGQTIQNLTMTPGAQVVYK